MITMKTTQSLNPAHIKTALKGFQALLSGLAVNIDDGMAGVQFDSRNGLPADLLDVTARIRKMIEQAEAQAEKHIAKLTLCEQAESQGLIYGTDDWQQQAAFIRRHPRAIPFQDYVG